MKVNVAVELPRQNCFVYIMIEQQQIMAWRHINYSLFILVFNQLDAQNLFHNKFISCLYMFRASYAHRQEVKIVLHSPWYHHNYRWPSRAQVERVVFQPVHRLRESSLNLCTGRPPIGVLIPEAV